MSSLFKDAIEGISAAAGTAVAVTQSLYGSLTGSAKKAPPPNASGVAREEAGECARERSANCFRAGTATAQLLS